MDERIKQARRELGLPDKLPEDKHPDLIIGSANDVLRTAWRRREAGDSLEAIRRDTGTTGVHDLDNRTLESALEQGRRLEQAHTQGRITARGKVYSIPCPWKRDEEG